MDYGTYDYKGKEIHLTQSPYLDFDGNNVFYQAHGIDTEENEYQLFWHDLDYIDSEEPQVDWDTFKVKEQ